MHNWYIESIDNESWMNEWIANVGIEPLWQLKRITIIFFKQMLALLNLCQFCLQQCIKCLSRGKNWARLGTSCHIGASKNDQSSASMPCVYGRFPFGLILEGKDWWDYISHWSLLPSKTSSAWLQIPAGPWYCPQWPFQPLWRQEPAEINFARTMNNQYSYIVDIC